MSAISILWEPSNHGHYIKAKVKFRYLIFCTPTVSLPTDILTVANKSRYYDRSPQGRMARLDQLKLCDTICLQA